MISESWGFSTLKPRVLGPQILVACVFFSAYVDVFGRGKLATKKPVCFVQFRGILAFCPSPLLNQRKSHKLGIALPKCLSIQGGFFWGDRCSTRENINLGFAGWWLDKKHPQIVVKNHGKNHPQSAKKNHQRNQSQKPAIFFGWAIKTGGAGGTSVKYGNLNPEGGFNPSETSPQLGVFGWCFGIGVFALRLMVYLCWCFGNLPQTGAKTTPSEAQTCSIFGRKETPT